jgi:hypothetical protein
MPLIIRRHSPPCLPNTADYKSFLREDFGYRCAYCTIHEGEFGGLRNFVVEHFRPKWLFLELEFEYLNLYYACCLCNNCKGRCWPSAAEVAHGLRFADPCEEDPYEIHFREQADGRLQPLTLCGDYTITHIRLNRPQLVRLRGRRRRAREEMEGIQTMMDELRQALVDVPEGPFRQSLEQHLEHLQRTLELLDKQFIHPRIPYEEGDLRVANEGSSYASDQQTDS